MTDDEFVDRASELMDRDHEIVYLHDDSGSAFAALIRIDFFQMMAVGPHFPPRDYKHDHIEKGEE
jgi:hypothetical protein